MPRRNVLTIVTLMAVVALVWQPRDAGAQERTGALQVDIVAADTRRPLPGVLVTLTDRGGNDSRLTSSADGRVEFTTLSPGLYSLTAETEGRVTAKER